MSTLTKPREKLAEFCCGFRDGVRLIIGYIVTIMVVAAAALIAFTVGVGLVIVLTVCVGVIAVLLVIGLLFAALTPTARQ